MRKFGKWLMRVILVLIIVIGGLWAIGPREPVERGAPFAGDVSDPAAYLAAREAAYDDITPGAEARVVWNGAPGTRTPISVLYLHGFSATSEEIRPVPDLVAEGLGANLVFARLRGHGRGGEALAAARAGEWIDDTAEALAVARAVGQEVLVIATSTGGTLAAYAMLEPDMAEGVAGLIFVSPNFVLANPAGAILELPLARHWVPLLVGADRSFPTLNDGHAAYWTSAYPTVAVIPMAALLRETRARDYSGVTVPALFLFSDDDTVVSAPAIRDFAQTWGGEVTLAPVDLPGEGVDPNNHVIAGDILSPAMTQAAADRMLDWARAALP